MSVYPDYAEFAKLAEEYNIIPVVMEMTTDVETPVSLYHKLVGTGVGFMLESAESGKNFGRYSFLGSNPFAVFTAKGKGVELTVDGATKIVNEPPLTALQDFMACFHSAPVAEDLPMLSGGAVGYFSYDIIGTFERVRGQQIPADLVLCQLLFCRELVVMDHLTHRSRLVVLARMQQGEELAVVYQQAVAELTLMRQRLEEGEPLTNGLHTGRQSRDKIVAPVSKAEYMAGVVKAQEHIKAGDVFQVVLSQSFTAPLDCSPFTLYRRLRQVNPSPYMFYFNFGQRHLAGASPEMLVKLAQGRLYTRPIAGTRPRGQNQVEDESLAAELLADKKELAEHTMLVDLGRNDLGRVCLPGTVKVERYQQVEMFSHVMHIVSDVSGLIKPEIGAVAALQACFPAGTVSGAPKVRAMEIIHNLEKRTRGPYAGAVGYIDFSGSMDTCITIRTLTVDDDEVTVQSGAGIVYDSVPETEYFETLHKAEALLKVVAGGGDQK